MRFSLFVFSVAILAPSALGQGGSCKDPWINNGYNYLYGRAPSGSVLTGECNINLYGNGRWTSYNDLLIKIQTVKGAGTTSAARGNLGIRLAAPVQNQRPAVQLALPPAGKLLVRPDLSIVDSAGRTVCAANSCIISQDGGGLISDAGGNLINPTVGMVISNDGGSFTVLNVGGKRVIKGKIVK